MRWNRRFSLSCAVILTILPVALLELLCLSCLVIKLCEGSPAVGIVDCLQFGHVTIGKCPALRLHGWQDVLTPQFSTLFGWSEEVRKVGGEILLDAREPHEDSEELIRFEIGGFIGRTACCPVHEVRHFLQELVFMVKYEQLVVLLDIEVIVEADIT